MSDEYTAALYEHQRDELSQRAELFERLLARTEYRELLDLLEAEAKRQLEALLLDADERVGKHSDAYLKGLIKGLRWAAALGSATLALRAQIAQEEMEDDSGQ